MAQTDSPHDFLDDARNLVERIRRARRTLFSACREPPVILYADAASRRRIPPDAPENSKESPMPDPSIYCFISYSRPDTDVARWLQNHLESY